MGASLRAAVERACFCKQPSRAHKLHYQLINQLVHRAQASQSSPDRWPSVCLVPLASASRSHEKKRSETASRRALTPEPPYNMEGGISKGRCEAQAVLWKSRNAVYFHAVAGTSLEYEARDLQVAAHWGKSEEGHLAGTGKTWIPLPALRLTHCRALGKPRNLPASVSRLVR